MAQSKLHQLAEFGQSIWLDYINREMIESGRLQQWIDDGLRGMTSNPSIFNQVISQGTDYDQAILDLKAEGKNTFEIYDALSIRDIQDAADCFQSVYQTTEHLDGYVSLEIDPRMADDTKASIKEGRRLFQTVNRSNIMIKVPATPAGFPVIEALLADGIPVNTTLIFSQAQYVHTLEAYLRGMKQFIAAGGNPASVKSVASVFISRIDTSIDKQLEAKIALADTPQKKASLEKLKGKAAVANSRMILEKFHRFFQGDVFKSLAAKGCAKQRVLWGSTSTKNPAYSDIKYVTELIAAPTVNTMPEKTLLAFMDHGEVKAAMTGSAAEAQKILADLREAGIDIDTVCAELLKEGLEAFIQAFDHLLKAIESKAKQLCSR
jgi:transaldolase/glucose-6-phosphate isomerase